MGHDVVVVGASAGGVEATRALVRGFPESLKAAVFLVVHQPEGLPSRLPELLTRSGPLPAAHARDDEPIEPGRIYVAQGGRHLLIERTRVRLSRGPQHNRHRPAVDPLFISAARTHGSRVVSVILSGALDDGTAGMLEVKRCGGIALVQTPATALFASMPQSAIDHVAVDAVLDVPVMAAEIARLAATRPAEVGPWVEERLEDEFQEHFGGPGAEPRGLPPGARRSEGEPE
jgi:two-component system, chemotaxis family, protein-glutamate methylesterase/glutaminase